MRRPALIAVLGGAQILAYGSCYYLPAVLGPAVAAETGWPLPWVVGGLSIGLLIAGLGAPRVGRMIDRRGGRRVLAASALLFAAGLVVLASAASLPVFLAGWLVIGLGMAAGLYDACFATLGRLYGQGARSAIASLTLVAGFANTVCWPLTALFLAHGGWRGACLAWAAIDIAVLLPAYWLAVPPTVPPPDPAPDAAAPGDRRAGLAALLVLGGVNVLSYAITAAMSVHLLALLTASGLTAGAAVAMGALLGPSQVGGRVVLIGAARRLHVRWGLLAWTLPMAAGLGVLWRAPGAAVLGLVCYGAGVGIGSIARGTVPLVLFGAAGYATRMGRLALPAQLAQAAAPVLTALLLGRAGAPATFAALAALAVLNAALAVWLVVLARPLRRA